MIFIDGKSQVLFNLPRTMFIKLQDHFSEITDGINEVSGAKNDNFTEDLECMFTLVAERTT